MIDAAEGTGRQPIARDLYRRILGQFASGVTVVTVRLAGETHGMTATAFAAVSLEPPLVLVCIDHHARTLPLLTAAGRFCVSILRGGQEALADHFAGRHGADRPTVADALETTASGAAIVRGCLAHADCRVVASYEAGDHSIVVGLVEEGAAAEGAPPLVHWLRRYYALPAPEP